MVQGKHFGKCKALNSNSSTAKKSSALLVMRKIQIKVTRSHTTLNKMSKIKIATIPTTGENIERQQFSDNTGRI
jgi:hypothetical protein